MAAVGQPSGEDGASFTRGAGTGGDEAAPAVPVVCLHGLGRTPADWDGVRAGLERFGPVLAPRLPRDPAAALDAADAAIAAAARGAADAAIAAAALELAGDAVPAAALGGADAPESHGVIVVGHSFGGVLALRLARERPRPLAALVLIDCFFPPARNGRGTLASLRDYGAHRVAYLRAAGSRAGAPIAPERSAPPIAPERSGTEVKAPERSGTEVKAPERSGGRVEATRRSGGLAALAGLALLGLRRGDFDAAADAVTAPVLVVHARDDHHVPLDFALAAATRHDWPVEILASGGHHAHVTRPEQWLAAVAPWLESAGPSSGWRPSRPGSSRGWWPMPGP